MFEALTHKLRRLQKMRLAPQEKAGFDAWLRVELTYTSNAIEGNALTRAETAVVLERGTTIAGKPLKDHLEAANHAAAYEWVRDFVRSKQAKLDERAVLEIHRLILKSIDDANAGRYRDVGVRVAGSHVIFPNPAKVPLLMRQFGAWLKEHPRMHVADRAIEAHYRLVTIHPFADGNGRTARLLMNLVLMRGGYPPAIVRPEDRSAYIRALEQAQLGGARDDFDRLMIKAIERSLDLMLNMRGGKTAIPQAGIRAAKLMTVGQLARRSGESAPTLRFWVKEGLLQASRNPAGYALFTEGAPARIRQIRKLQDRRFTLAEIRDKMKG